MKLVNKIVCISAAVLAVSSCFQKETYPPYEAGEVEQVNENNVHFLTPAEGTAFQLAPDAEKKITLTAERDSTKTAITVPVVITADNEAAEGIFTISELNFGVGEKTANIDITFPNAEAGVLYKATLSITDPNYIHTYSNVAKSISFSVQRVKWNALGNLTYFDKFLMETPIELPVEQRDDDHTYYRFAGPSSTSLVGQDGGGLSFVAEPTEWITLHIMKKGEKIGDQALTINDYLYYEEYNSGFHHDSYGADIMVCPPWDGFKNTATPDTWVNNKVLGYQESGVPTQAQIAPYHYMYGVGGWNHSGSAYITLTFPGFVPTDYSVYMETDYPENGVTPVYVEIGSDVASIKYAVYEGTFGQGGADKKIEPIANGTDASTTVALADFTYDEDYGVNYTYLEVSPEKTGLYTLVAVSFDAEGNAQEAGFVNFNFVAAADEAEHAVVVSVGTEDVSARYEASGYNKRNSFAYWISGKDLTEVHVAVVAKSKLTAATLSSLKYSADPVSADVLAAINSEGGYATLATGLNALADYAVVVWATNGDLDDYAVAYYTTEGLPRELVCKGTYTYASWWAGDDDAQELYLDPNYKDTYVFPNWGGGVDFIFTKDAQGVITIPLFAIGASHSSYGTVYYMESANYFDAEDIAAEPELGEHSYVDEDGVYHFHFALCVSAGAFGDFWETYTPEGVVVSDPASAPSAIESMSLVSAKPLAIPSVENIVVERNPQPVQVNVKVNNGRAPLAKENRRSFEL